MAQQIESPTDLRAMLQEMFQQQEEKREEREERQRKEWEGRMQQQEEKREEREKREREEERKLLREELIARHEEHRRELKKMSDGVRSWISSTTEKQQQLDVAVQTQHEELEKLTQETEKSIRQVENHVEEIDQVVTEIAQETKVNKNKGEEKVLLLQEQFKQLQKQITQISVDKVTYVYKNAEDLPRVVKFNGEDHGNPMEFLINCEKAMETVGSHLTDSEKVDWIARRLEHPAAQWYAIVREKVSSYEDFRSKFEVRYWNDCVQRKIREKLEFGRYVPQGKSQELYVIDLVAKAKHLWPKISEHHMVKKLSYHFHLDISVAVLTRGITTVEEFLLMLTQWNEIRNMQRQAPRNDDQTRSGQYEDRNPQHSYSKNKYTKPEQKLQWIKYPHVKSGKNSDVNKEVTEVPIASTSR